MRFGVEELFLRGFVARNSSVRGDGLLGSRCRRQDEWSAMPARIQMCQVALGGANIKVAEPSSHVLYRCWRT